jgi:hypothetical protein
LTKSNGLFIIRKIDGKTVITFCINYIPSTNMFKFPQNPPARAELVQSIRQCARNMIVLRNYLESQFLFTFSSESKTIGSFVLIFRRVVCSRDTFFNQLLVESVKKGSRLEILSFFTDMFSLKDQAAGDRMFKGDLIEIIRIFSVLRFESDVFLRIARAIVPPEYAVVMHRSEDNEQGLLLFNPFCIGVDYFGLKVRLDKRSRNPKFVPKDLQAVEVVENENSPKKR